MSFGLDLNLLTSFGGSGLIFALVGILPGRAATRATVESDRSEKDCDSNIHGAHKQPYSVTHPGQRKLSLSQEKTDPCRLRILFGPCTGT